MNKETIERHHGLKLIELPQNAKHEVGKTYFCGYWQQTYTVLEYKDLPDTWMLYEVTCQWADGSITKHGTDLKPGEDWEVRQ